MSAKDERALIAGQLADLTHAVEQMVEQLKALRERADTQQERADTQQERIDLAAKELAEVSARLQAAANALRESIWSPVREGSGSERDGICLWAARSGRTRHRLQCSLVQPEEAWRCSRAYGRT